MNEILQRLQKKTETLADGNFVAGSAVVVSKYLDMPRIEASHFLGQCAVETGWFTDFYENVNYSQAQLMSTFAAFKDPLLAKKYERKPEAIANRAYANRFGNGDELSGDGWRWRGRGLIQTTFYANYLALSRGMNLPEILENPDLVAEEYALESAYYYWTTKKIQKVCLTTEIGSVTAVTAAVNGRALHGLKKRHEATLRIESWLKQMNY